jgi:hypothetical protein
MATPTSQDGTNMATNTAVQQPIRSNIPARLDRLRWSPFHTRTVLGLGTAWILDHIQVQLPRQGLLRHGRVLDGLILTIEAEPFDAFAVHPAGVAVYHLGNNGTARKLLKAWPVTNA